MGAPFWGREDRILKGEQGASVESGQGKREDVIRGKMRRRQEEKVS
jgi:hypothetical protein